MHVYQEIKLESSRQRKPHIGCQTALLDSNSYGDSLEASRLLPSSFCLLVLYYVPNINSFCVDIVI